MSRYDAIRTAVGHHRLRTMTLDAPVGEVSRGSFVEIFEINVSFGSACARQSLRTMASAWF